MEFITGIFGKLIGVDMVQLGMWLIVINTVLSGIGRALEFIKDKTETDADNKAFDIVNKISGILLKLIDIMSANVQHKPKPAKAPSEPNKS